MTVEGLTPKESPGSYTLCWDMINADGAYFSDEGGNEYCAPYTIAQYPPAVSEQEPLPGTDVDTQSPQLSASATVAGGYPAVPAFSFAFELLNGPNLSTAKVLQSSGWVPDNGESWAPSALTWGTTYYWAAAVTDASSPPSPGSAGAPWTTPISFVVGNAQPTVASRFGNLDQASDGNPVLTTDLAPSRTTTDTYDVHGNLASVRDPLGNVTSYTYDGLGDKLTQTDPDRRPWFSSPNGPPPASRRNEPAGNLVADARFPAGDMRHSRLPTINTQLRCSREPCCPAPARHGTPPAPGTAVPGACAGKMNVPYSCL